MKKRNYLSAEDAKIIIDEWGNKTIEELAEMFEVSPNTIDAMAREVRKVKPDLCKPRARKRRTRKSIAQEAVKMWNDEKGILPF